MSLQQIQNTLVEDVWNKSTYYAELKLCNKMESKSIHLYAKKHKLFETILELSTNYTNYYKKDFIINSVIIKEIKSKNPHIKLHGI